MTTVRNTRGASGWILRAALFTILLVAARGAYAQCPSFPHTVAAGDVSDLVLSITCANANTTDDVINLTNSTYTLTAADNVTVTPDGGTDGNGLPGIASAATSGTLTIYGNGATIARDASAPDFRIFYLHNRADLTLDGLTLSNGSATSDGAAIYVDGPATGSNMTMLTVTNSTFSDNSAGHWGGAIAAYAHVTLTVSNSTFSGNLASNLGGVLYLGHTNVTLSATDSTFSGNKAPSGGAIVGFGMMTVSGSTFSSNTATTEYGGAIYVPSGATLILTDSTLSGNKATLAGAILNQGLATLDGDTFSGNSTTSGGGGAVYHDGATALTVTNSTFYGNTAVGKGGAINANNASATTTITNSTLAGNSASAGGGINNAKGILNLNNSIVAGSTSGGDCYLTSGTINAESSLVQDGLGCVNGTNSNNLTGDPMLDALAGNGGPTDTMALQDGSPAINAGDNTLAVDETGTALSYDQRGSGYSRIAGSIVDMGAYEAQSYTYDFVVDRTDDQDIEGCSATPDDCTLRGAINLANAIGGTHTITFDSSVFNPGTITLTSALPAITSKPTIEGLGASLVTVSGANTYRVFVVNSGATATFKAITIADGKVTNDSGAGIYNSGSTTVTDSVVTHNAATGGTSATGGGIYNYGTLVVNGSTIANNSSAYLGGGLYNDYSKMTVVNSTVTGNSAQYGAGLFNANPGSTLTVTNSTIAGNTATANGGGIFNYGDTLNLNNSIVAGNSGGSQCADASGSDITNAQNSLIQDSLTCVNGTNTNNLTGDPLLGSLTGTPAYYLLDSGSPAIDSADNSICAASPVNDVDQRGAMRPQDGNGDNVAICDMGSYEVPDTTPPTVTVEQASGQADPTNASPIHFTATFSEAIDVSTFASSDVTLGGSAPGTLSAVITESSPNNGTTFDIAVSGMSGSGTVTASIAAGKVKDLAGNGNTASTSNDNTVTYDVTAPTVTGTGLQPTYVNVGPASFTVTFSEAMTDTGSSDPESVTNPANYLVVEAGSNLTFETASCSSGRAGDDIQVPISGVTYDNGTMTATVTFGNPPGLGTYRLFVCGSTSITDLAGNKLDSGTDQTVNFAVAAITAIPAASTAGLVLLVLLLAAGALAVLRR